jgi:uncharacterized zinc-type alcohol dehydrogenase-like protein
MQMIHAYAAFEQGGELRPYTYEPAPLAANEVEIAVEYCGLCHSDLSMLNNEWRSTAYPFVPGHEVAGRIAALGAAVTHFKVGERVGLGWHSAYCNHCHSCLSGDHNLCDDAQGTIVQRHGGFADKVRAQASAVVKLPSSLPMHLAGPLFCGGITVFNPIMQYGVKPTDKVAVVGIGGLGHLALQFLNKWGCEVTAFTSTAAKRDEALALGAQRTLDSNDKDAMKAHAGYFDFILVTVNVNLDWRSYVKMLSKRGRLHFVGVIVEPISLSVSALMDAQRSVSSSPVGSPAMLATMLDFAARHRIYPQVEEYPLAQVNEAISHLAEGKARYRVVLKING